MALSLLCGGLGVASAEVDVKVDVSSAPGAVVVYTKTGVDTLLADYGKKEDVQTNKDDITALQNTTTTQGNQITANTTQIANNTADIEKKIDKEIAEAKLALKANVTDVYSKTDADARYATRTELDAKADATALDGKADITYVDQKFKEAGNNVDAKLLNYATTTEVDGKIADEVNARNNAITNAIGLERNDRDAAIDNAINGEVNARNQAINTAIGLEATKRDAAIANAKTELEGKITAEQTARKEADVELSGKINEEKTARTTKDAELDGKINDEKAVREAEDTNLSNRIGKVAENGNYIKDSDTNSVSKNLRVLDAQAKINADAIAAETVARAAKDTELEGEITKNSQDITNLQGDVTTAQGDITDLQKKDTELEGRIKTNEGNIETNKNAISDINKRTAGIQRIDATKETTIEGNVTVNSLGNVTAKGKLTGEGVDAGDGAITTTGAVNAGSLKVENASNLKGDVTMGKTLKVTGDTSLKKTDVDGALTVTGESSLKNTTVGGTLGVTGETTLSGELKAEKDATFEKNVTVEGTTNLKDTTVKGDLNVTGTITTKKMVFGDKATNNYTEIDHGKVTSTNLEVRAGQAISSSSTFDVEKNEVGFGNGITDEQSSHKQTSDVITDTVKNNNTGDQSFHKQTSDVIMDNVKDGKNSNNRTQTKTETKDIITDENGNSSTTSQTASQNKTYLKDKDGKNTNSTIDTAKEYDKTIKGENGKTSTKQTATDITNTAEAGTIKNTAKNVTNEGTESVTNTVGGNEVKVSKDGVDIKAEAGKKIKESVGTASRVVENDKITDNAGDSTVTTENGKGTTFGKEGSTGTTNIYEDSIKTGKINAKDTTTDKLTAGAAADADGGRLTVDADGGVKGSYKSGDYTSRSYILANTLKSGVDNGKKPTEDGFVGSRTDHYMAGDKAKLDETVKDADGSNVTNKTSTGTATTITDGNGKTSATIQDVKNLAGSVTNGTETGVSGIHANDDGSVSIDSAVSGEGGSSVINQKKDSITSAVGNADGSISTVIRQDKDNVTIASSNGAVAIVGKDIVSNAQETITNTAGTSITNQVKDSKVTTDVDGTTFENKTAAVSDGGATTTKINGNQITTGRVDANELGVSDKDGTNTADLSVKAGEGVKASATDGTTTGSLDVKADEVVSSVTNTDGTHTNMSQTADGIKGYATDKDGNKTYTKVTATENSFQVQDKDGNIKNHQVNTKDKSENTIKNGDKTNTVTSTADGTTFKNSKANTAFEGGTYTDTTINGNTITTGKVTMDYAEVMKDLGVHGSAKVDQNLEVGGTSTLKGDVTMESNAKVKKDLTVEGTTTTKTLKVTENAEIDGTLKVAKKATFEDSVSIAKDLSVDGNATIKGDVTASSYKVGRNTYIDANGINANNQKITNVADGSISEGSKDAVNGGQLYDVKRDMEHKVDKVGANAAAMANLRPMEFDPSSKWNIAAAIGNYGSETAAALGAFYRPNDDVMVNLSTAFGTGENMVGGGVSVRLGKGSNKLSREENNALKDQVNDLTARMDALLSVLNPNMSKDFPDVPENHWAYEAVSRLAGNDIVQGYPDGEFHGERTMTRYEMAEIIYNALSRGAEAEKELVEEFKPELQAMAASEKATAERAEG